MKRRSPSLEPNAAFQVWFIRPVVWKSCQYICILYTGNSLSSPRRKKIKQFRFLYLYQASVKRIMSGKNRLEGPSHFDLSFTKDTEHLISC